MAAQNGQREVCNALIKMKADTNATDVQGQTPLHLAAENNHSDVVKLFLKHRPELVTMANTNGMTCAHIAAAKGSAAVIKELMRFNKIIMTTARNK
ncbi:serine/threonine-protein phosphatase 6 regulatory ankyrin repeat subunit A-like, partial [Elysia marginata]